MWSTWTRGMGCGRFGGRMIPSTKAKNTVAETMNFCQNGISECYMSYCHSLHTGWLEDAESDYRNYKDLMERY